MPIVKIKENILLSPLKVRKGNNNRYRNIWKIDKENKQRNYIKKSRKY